MANKHVYFGIENLALTNAQRNTLVSGLQSLGISPKDAQPANRNHWRIRLDNQAVIFEALFDEDNISVAGIKSRLANLFSVDVSLVSSVVQQTAYGPMATYSYSGTDRIRLIAFGYDGGWPDWSVSGDAARQYLADNSEAWEPAL